MIGLLFPNVKGKRGALLRGLCVAIPVLILVILAVVLPREVVTPFNVIAWGLSNALLWYSAVTLVLFLSAYFYFFDPRATTGGRLIFQFMMSLMGVISLNVIGIFINPSRDLAWYIFPPGVEPWRPVIRLVIYGFVAYAVTSLAVLLVLRKWFPHKLRKASDITLVKVRNSDDQPQDPLTIKEPVIHRRAYPRTGEIPTYDTDLIEETWPKKREK